MIYARPGDIVTCERGHPLFLVLEEVNSSAPALPSKAFECINARMTPPTPNAIVRQCYCGARWFRSKPWCVKNQLHLEGGWNPPNGYKPLPSTLEMITQLPPDVQERIDHALGIMDAATRPMTMPAAAGPTIRFRRPVPFETRNPALEVVTEEMDNPRASLWKRLSLWWRSP